MMPTPDHGSRLLAISDIHGHGEGLLLLLREAGYDPHADRLILLGDYVDADPSTWSTLDTIRDLTRQGAEALPGNMEAGLIGRKAWNGAPPSVLEWLGALPSYIVADGCLFVHAGIRPGLPLERQTFRDLTEIREEFWQQAPDCGLTVIFGHTPTFKLGAAPGSLWFAERRIGIDTGAKHGQRLTLLDVHGGIAYSCSTSPACLYGDVRADMIPEAYTRRCH